MDPYSFTNDPDLGTVAFNPINQDYNALGLDRPMVIAEFNNGQSQVSAALDSFVARNYAGAFAWSYTQGDGLLLDFTQFTTWGITHSNIVNGQTSPQTQATQQTSQTGASNTASVESSSSIIHLAWILLLVCIANQ